MSWEPKGGIRSVDLADENTNNVFINIDGEKLYYNNYDFDDNLIYKDYPKK